jgi:hypothetical protein
MSAEAGAFIAAAASKASFKVIFTWKAPSAWQAGV